jgi:GT2 family glycosyltransferase
MMIRRDDYIKLGGLDEDFVCYVEESDLCHRIWLSGKKVLYEPSVHIYHWGGGDMQVMTKDEVTMYRSYRNRFFSYIKNLSIFELIKILPILLIFCEGFIAMTILSGSLRRAAGAQLGILSVIVSLPRMLKKRKYVQQKIRKVSDSEINKYVLRNPRLSYYFHFFKNPASYKD